MTATEILLWDVLPYVTIAVFVVGMVRRYRYDKFGWTTRSSQLYERSLLRIASPLFHLGMLAVVAGHVIGLMIPEDWTHALGISEDMYHVNAIVVGGLAGIATLVGVALLVYRRRTSGPVFAATTKNDKTMYVFLVAAICLGLLATMTGAGVLGDGYNYRETVSVWFRSIFLLQPQGELMADTPLAFRVHALSGLALFLVWPFTRLVHAFSAPVGYLFRPYVVYRTRAGSGPGNRDPRPGWDRTKV
jgi:nitrate reductase gamma subunit